MLPDGIPTHDALVLPVGPFPFHLRILLYHCPSRRVCLVSLFGICRRDSHIANTVVRQLYMK